MSLYGSTMLSSDEAFAESDALIEAYLIDDLLRQPSEVVREFCESAEAQILQEKQVLKKPSLMRLSKADDQRRRVKLTAYQLAKDNNDPEWTKLKKLTEKRKQSIAKIMKKYGTKAEKISKVSQKKYIKTAQKLKATKQDQIMQNAKA